MSGIQIGYVGVTCSCPSMPGTSVGKTEAQGDSMPGFIWICLISG